MAGDSNLTTKLLSLDLQSPLIAAAGTCGYIAELPTVCPPHVLGAITTKSITVEPRTGNDPIRMVDLPDGMLNAIGLANVGLDRFMDEKLPDAASAPVPIIGSIAGGSVDEYVQIASTFDRAAHLKAIELNVSCPNTSDGLEFGTDAARLRELVSAVAAAIQDTILIVKLSPNVTDLVSLAAAAIDGGAQALTLINTVSAMAVDVRTRQPRISRVMGGMSGPAVHPIAVRAVHTVYQGCARDANVPIIGLGGVTNWEDAAELILVGATAVGVGTALFARANQPVRIHKGLQRWVRNQGASHLSELIGAVEL